MQQPDRGLVMLFAGSYQPPTGGAHAVVHNMAEQLVRRGYRVRLFAGGEADSVDSSGRFTVVQVAARKVAERRASIASWWLTQRRIARALDSERERPVAVHVFDPEFGWAAVKWAQRNGVRSIVTLADDNIHRSSGPAASLRNFLIGRTLRRAGMLTSPSRALAELLGAAQGAKNVHVVPHGIDFTAAAGVENSSHIRRWFGVPADAFLFLSAQPLYPGKTPVNAVRAFAEATVDRRHAFLLIVGDGPGRAAVERVARETAVSSRVLLAGGIHHHELAAYMRAADAFVIDTAFESLGVTAAEAMAAGLPILATRTGAMPEIVEDGRTGLLSRFGDVDSMANDMRRIMTNPELRDHIKAEARRAGASFDWSSIAEQYTAGYGAA